MYVAESMSFGEAMSIGAPVVLTLAVWVLPAFIIQRKGHGWRRVALYLLLGMACWPVAIILAAIAPTLIQGEDWQNEGFNHDSASAQNQSSLDSSGSFTRVCERCGTVNDDLLEACSNCGHEFEPGAAGLQLQTTPDAEPSDTTLESRETTSDRIAVACLACGGNFSGTKGRLAVVRSCPKCGHAPFHFRRVSNR